MNNTQLTVLSVPAAALIANQLPAGLIVY